MKKLIPLFCFIAVSAAQAQNAKPADGPGVPGPFTFQKRVYNLVLASHPAAAYYRQEYRPKGDTVERFKTMLLPEALLGTETPKTRPQNWLS